MHIKYKQLGITQEELYNLCRRHSTMMRRCYNPKSISYKRYGGKGITVCSEWHNKDTFYKWAVQNGFNINLTLDRIDGTKGYSPENCRWVDNETQSNNRNCVRKYDIDGEILSLAQISRKYNITLQKLLHRIDKRGLTIQQAIDLGPNFATKLNKIGQYSLDDNKLIGIYKSQKEVAEKFNIKKQNISACLKGISKTCGGYKWQYLS